MLSRLRALRGSEAVLEAQRGKHGLQELEIFDRRVNEGGVHLRSEGVIELFHVHTIVCQSHALIHSATKPQKQKKNTLTLQASIIIQYKLA